VDWVDKNLTNVNGCPGEGPGHDREGPRHRPNPEERLPHAFRTRPFSPDRKAVFGDASRRRHGPPAKARERRVSGASRNVEVGGSGGQGVKAQGAERPSRVVYRRGAPRRRGAGERVAVRGRSHRPTGAARARTDPSVQYPASYAALGVSTACSMVGESLSRQNRGVRG